MNRRTLLTFLALALFPAAAYAAKAVPMALTPQDQADLSRIEAYLDSLKNLKARFLQVAPDGTVSEGNAYLSRPGRMRFEYDKPSPFLLVAGFGSAVFYDKQLNQTTSVPLGTTPLGILLADHVRLSGDITVTGIQRDPGQIQITTTRTNSPEDGSLTLVFADKPLALRQWAVLDAQRQETRVSLFSIELGGDFPASMFQFEDPRLRQRDKNN
jgi:outer membrane lipoprotein-sorting protein